MEAGRENAKMKKGFKMPHVFVILFTLIAIMALLTHVIPAGEYVRVPGPNNRMMVDPNQFNYVESNPSTLLDFLTAIPHGIIAAANVIAFTLILPGAFQVIQNTGLLVTVISKLAKRFSKNGILIVPVLMIATSLLAAFVGTAELSMVYISIIMPLALMMGFDTMLAAAIPLIATNIGFIGAFTNPFTVGIAHQIAGLPEFSGMWFRVLLWIVFITFGIIYTMRYAKKIQLNPELSLTYESDNKLRASFVHDDEDEEILTTRQKGVAVVFVASFVVLVYGIISLGWGMNQMAGIFIAMGVVGGLVGGLDQNEISESFIEGGKKVYAGALLVGIARGVTIVMEDALIIDTVVHYLAQVLVSLPRSINAIGMLGVQSVFNILVPSGSGQALITMPILSPLADIVGVNQQVAVVALQLGDGITNLFTPTNGYFVATLAIAGIAWSDWVKFIWKWLAFELVLGSAILIFAQAINLGPF